MEKNQTPKMPSKKMVKEKRLSNLRNSLRKKKRHSAKKKRIVKSMRTLISMQRWTLMLKARRLQRSRSLRTSAKL